jgi:ParB-like chromosome segregation protein Spo0J
VLVTVMPIPADYERGEDNSAEARYWVLKGNRRLAGARKVDLKDLLEQAEALFAAHQAGATRTAIRKRTGRTREEISAGIAAGKLSQETRQAVAAMEHVWTLG